MQVRTFLSALGCRWRAVHPLLALSGCRNGCVLGSATGTRSALRTTSNLIRLWGSSLDCDSKEAGTVEVNGPMARLLKWCTGELGCFGDGVSSNGNLWRLHRSIVCGGDGRRRQKWEVPTDLDMLQSLFPCYGSIGLGL